MQACWASREEPTVPPVSGSSKSARKPSPSWLGSRQRPPSSAWPKLSARAVADVMGLTADRALEADQDRLLDAATVGLPGSPSSPRPARPHLGQFRSASAGSLTESVLRRSDTYLLTAEDPVSGTPGLHLYSHFHTRGGLRTLMYRKHSEPSVRAIGGRKTRSMTGTPITKHRRGRTAGSLLPTPLAARRREAERRRSLPRPQSARAPREAGTRTRGSRRSTTAPTRGDPDEDSDPDRLAAELQAASDALIRSWFPEPEQLTLDGRWS
jgi:hypothetical protein